MIEDGDNNPSGCLDDGEEDEELELMIQELCALVIGEVVEGCDSSASCKSNM